MGLSFWEHRNGDKPNPPFQPTPLPLLHARRGGGNATVLEQPVSLDTLVDRYSEFAERFIRRSAEADKSFYLYVPFNHIHAPNSCSVRFCGKSRRGPVGDATEEADWAVGRIMGALQSAGVDNDTITFFTSDNGAPLNNDVSGNHPLRGGKAQVWEGGFREPGIVRWPGRIAPGSISQAIVSTMDIHPTLLGLAGVPLPTDRIIDGIDLSSILFGRRDGRDAGHACYFMYRAAAAVNASGELFAVRCGDVKAYFATWGVAPPKPYLPGRQDPPLLFNLLSDPGEATPLDRESQAYRAALAAINTAKASHLATLTPVPDQNGRGSDDDLAVCSDPRSKSKFPQWPPCTINPENWRPAATCASSACLKANPAFEQRCANPELLL
jgi:arylsulfatase A